jgi:hypothetical protein
MPYRSYPAKALGCIVLLSFVVAGGCLAGSSGHGEGLAPSEQGPGPTIVFDPVASGTPAIPFPNDVAAVFDGTSPTGLRLDISTKAPTAHERATREMINTLSGFGTFAPITVSFDKPLDIEALKNRHNDCRTFSDDSVLVVNLDRASPRFGQAVCLDFDQGYFPVLTRPRPAQYLSEDPRLAYDFHLFANDPRRLSSNLLFETYEEDTNCNDVLDAGEDTDQDGLLDHPNAADPKRFNPACAEYQGRPFSEKDDLVSCFEYQTNTLIIRPVIPLDERTPYAVVLTKRLTGIDGNPVRSPFPFVHHISQTKGLEVLGTILPEFGLGWADVAFAWRFTTQDVTGELFALREGLYGTGPFSWLARRFEPSVTVDLVRDPHDSPNPYLLDGSLLVTFFRAILSLPEGIRDLLLSLVTPHPPAMVEEVVETFEAIDYLVYGTFETPYLVAGQDGTFHLDVLRGSAQVAADTVPFWLAVPKARGTLQPPFPVAVYGHGYTDCRTEMFLYMGSLARMGIASLSFNMPGHGCPLLGPSETEQLRPLTSRLGLDHLLDAMNRSRGRDLTGDGMEDSGADFWTADTFHTRDMVRQTVLDCIELVRVMRAFDGRRPLGQDLNGDGIEERAGDFNADGIVDIGGPDGTYFYWGQSLGGIVAGIMAGAEPALSATVPVSGGGGLADIAIRTIQEGTVQAVQLFIQGPLITGAGPAQGGPLEVAFDLNDYYLEYYLPFAAFEDASPLDLVEVENATNGEIRTGMVLEEHVLDQKRRPTRMLHFRVPIPADAGDRILVRLVDGKSGRQKDAIDRFEGPVVFHGTTYEAGSPLVSPASGFGIRRNSPEMRRFVGLAQMILEPADPINYVDTAVGRSPGRANGPDGGAISRNVLIVNTIGDMNVPIHTGISLGRAAGLIDTAGIEPRFGTTPSRVLIDHYVPEGIEAFKRFGASLAGLCDVDDLDGSRENFPGTVVPTLAPPLRITKAGPAGVSAVRFPYLALEGAHTFLGPSPWRPFDIERFLINQIGWYFRTGGRELTDDPCLADDSCTFFPR